MELLQLTYFCEAARCENFSHTAEKFNVPTSNISQTVKRLEDELGVKLFRRGSNKIHLSEEGRIFYEGARRALDALSDARAALCGGGEGSDFELRLLIGTCRRIVTRAIEKFQKIYPRASVSINHTVGEDNSEYDFIISDTIERNGDYRSEFLMSERIVLAAKRGSRVELERPQGFEDLVGERFIALDGSQLNNYIESMCRVAGFVPNIAIRTDDPFYVRKYVEMGLGIAFVPEVSWRGLFSDEVALIELCDYTRNINLYVRSGKILSEGERVFLKILKETFEEERTSC